MTCKPHSVWSAGKVSARPDCICRVFVQRGTHETTPPLQWEQNYLAER